MIVTMKYMLDREGLASKALLKRNERVDHGESWGRN